MSLTRIVFALCIIAIFVVDLNASDLRDTYVVKTLTADDKCINSSTPMADYENCPVPTFPVVNITHDAKAVAVLDALAVMKPSVTKDCYATILNLMCVMVTLACSDDQKYGVRLLDRIECMDHLECLPKEQYTEGSKTGICNYLPDKTATIVPGPGFNIVVKTMTSDQNSSPTTSQLTALKISTILVVLTALL